MVILLKSWRGNMVVKLFTAFVSEYFKIFLRNSYENLGNSSREIPRNWFWRPIFATNFLWVFWRIGDKKFPGIGYKKFLGYSYENLLRMGYKKFFGPGYEKFLGIAVDIFTGFSCEIFLGISADFPQNCYLGCRTFLGGNLLKAFLISHFWFHVVLK